MRDIEEILAEGREQGDNWNKWFRRIKGELRQDGPEGSGALTQKELNDLEDRIEAEGKKVDTGLQRNLLEQLENAVRWNKKKLTDENIGDAKIAQEVELYVDAKSPDFNWSSIRALIGGMKNMPEYQDAGEWFETVVDNARSKGASQVNTFKLGRKFNPFAKVDLSKYKGREAYYDYWQSVASHYDETFHVEFLESLKKDVSSNDKFVAMGKETGKTLHDVIDSLIAMPAPKIHTVVGRQSMSGLDKETAVLDAFLDRMARVDDDIFWSATEGTERDEAGQVIDTVLEIGDKANMTADEREKQAEEQSELADKANWAQEGYEEVRDTGLDPLLHFAVESGKVAVPFDAQSFKRERLLEGMEEALVFIDPEAWDEFQEFIEELGESADKFVDKNEFHLPLVDMKEEWKDTGKGRQLVKPGSEHWVRFFEDLGNLIYDIPHRFSIKQAGARVGFGSKSGSQDKGAQAAIDGMRRATTISFPQDRPPKEGQSRTLEMEEGTQKLYEELLQKMIAYYIEPSGSQYYYKGKPRYTEISQFKNLIMSSTQTKMRKRYERIKEGHVDNFGADDLEPISDFIEMVQSQVLKVEPRLIRAGKQARQGIDVILGADEDNKQFIGDILYQIAHHQAQDTDALKFEGDSLEDWHTIEENDSNQVLHDIHEFMESTPIKTNLNLRDTSKPIEESRIIEGKTGEGKRSTVSKKKYDAVKKLITLITELKKSELDPITMRLLHAHDMIRKMTGQKLTYARLNVDNPNHISKVMENVSVTAPEILTIVKSYDSHKNLSLKHGISENEVYMIKGMFR